VRAVAIGERTGVLVLRVWIEAGSGEFRARITAESELGSGERVSVVAGSLEEILEFVSRWVEEFRARRSQ
jgi:hypothetical protein